MNDSELRTYVQNSKSIGVAEALQSLRPGAQWVLRGHEYDGLEWHDDDQGQPARNEVEVEIERLKDLKEDVEYRNDRQVAYLPIQDQLDLQYWDSINGTTNWADHIEEVKAANPKPVPTV